LNKINLPDSLKYKQEPHLSFDNSEIAFISDSTIYKVDVNGNNLKRLLANRNANILYKLFSFSADNKDIIYSTQNTLTNYLIDLHLLNINSLADTVLFNANISNYEHPGLENSPGDIILFSYDNTFDQININNFAESTASGSNANYSYDYSKITLTDPDTSYIIRILDLAAHVNKKIKISLPKSKTAISITNSKICSDGETVIFACHREIFY